jgi:hypothetical protein
MDYITCSIINHLTSLLAVYGPDGDPELDVRGINVQNDGNRNYSRSYTWYAHLHATYTICKVGVITLAYLHSKLLEILQ